jgi:UDP-N-acetylglucosamine diphosphorylase/glucosamine-1-phosphate N-acetyltransferase
MHLCIYEDARSGNFLPLTYFRPVFDLRCGVLTLREKIVRRLPHTSLSLVARPFLADVLREENPGAAVNSLHENRYLFMNGRLILDAPTAALFRRQKTDAVFVNGNEIVAALSHQIPLPGSVESPDAAPIDPEQWRSLPHVPVQVRLAGYPWDLLSANAAEIGADVSLLRGGISRRAKIHRSAILAGRTRITVGPGTDIGPGAILDARKGPIVIGERVTVYPGAVLEGPCAVGNGSVVRIHAKVYAGTTIGPVCKVGGEIEGSILHSYANKQHDGFLGDSYLGLWVNLGAGTTNSNLKNTYGTVRVTINGVSVDSGSLFVGVIAGDHAKAGINSTINTGTVIGPSANFFGGGMSPKVIPAFSWGGATRTETYRVDKALDVAVTVMARRSVKATEAYKELFRNVFSMTAHEREQRTP